MANLEFLIPCRKDHAVKEAVLTVFVDAPISDIKSFQELEQHGILEYFKRFEIINQNHFNITLNDNIPNVDAQKLNESGFKFIDYNDGIPSKVFQGMNEPNRYYFSFHDLSYDRWEQFKKLFAACIGLLGKHKGKYSVMAYSLHVVDEFSWNHESPIPYGEIFRVGNKIIPSIFNESKSVDYLISRTTEDGDGVERIQINGIYNDGVVGSKLILSHNYTEIMSTSEEALVLIQSEAFAKKINLAHQQNKLLIENLFNDVVLKMIHYN
jgi:uncharacterized protein (TIGR04255 family)